MFRPYPPPPLQLSHSKNVCYRIKGVKLLNTQFFPSTVTSSVLYPNIFLDTLLLCSHTPSMFSFTWETKLHIRVHIGLKQNTSCFCIIQCLHFRNEMRYDLVYLYFPFIFVNVFWFTYFRKISRRWKVKVRLVPPATKYADQIKGRAIKHTFSVSKII
jgi:hypothetical protein